MARTKLYNFIKRILVFSASLLAFTYLIYIFNNKINTVSLTGSVLAIKNHSLIILIVLALMLLNWGLEIFKWRYFTIRIQYISINQSIKSILLGIVAGVFTPNRLGELGGRLLYIRKKNRSNAIYINSWCSIAQLTTTLLFGIAALYSIEYISAFRKVPSILRIGGFLLSIVVLLLVFFKGNVVRGLILKFNAKFRKVNTTTLLQLNSVDRLKILLFSTFRYLVFCLQFVLLLFVFIPDLSFIDGFRGAALIFFLTTIIPSGWISDLPIRTSFAFIVFEFLEYDGTYGSLASVILWVINLFIPAFLGLFITKEIKWNTKDGK